MATPCVHDSGSIAWIVTSTALVLLMIPALALFEAGLLRAKNSLSIFSQIFSGFILLCVLWYVFGYSLVYGDPDSPFIGNFEKSFFIDVSYTDCGPFANDIPEALYAMFQMMFATICPLLMTGAFAERFKFRAYVPFIILWEILVYFPVAHWIWNTGGFLAKWDVLDFAGGITIHETAGVGALVTALYLGRRAEFHTYSGEWPPSNIPLAGAGMTLLMIGWCGFNGGSALGANAVAVSAIVSTQIGAATSGFVWLMISWYRHKPSSVALLNGCLAGLAGITPASGYINSPASFLLGSILGFASYGSVHLLKHKWHIDDALDVSSVHGLPGIIGAIFIGLFSQQRLNPNGHDGAFYGNPSLLGRQIVAVILVGVYTAVMTYIILRFLSLCFGGRDKLRVSAEEEEIGLDHSEHGEVAYTHHHHPQQINKPAAVNSNYQPMGGYIGLDGGENSPVPRSGSGSAAAPSNYSHLDRMVPNRA